MKRLLVLVALALAALVVPSFSHADAAPVNLARGAVATASSQENAAYRGGQRRSTGTRRRAGRARSATRRRSSSTSARGRRSPRSS